MARLFPFTVFYRLSGSCYRLFLIFSLSKAVISLFLAFRVMCVF